MSEYFSCPVITISREYGAGGRHIARALSEKLNIQWYDQDFVKEAARDSGFSKEEIEIIDGNVKDLPKNIIDVIMNAAVTYNAKQDKLFEVQKQEVLKLADHPCIILGRASNIILREAGVKTFDVFLYADYEHRRKTIEAIGEAGDADLRKFIDRRDSMRKNYYKHYTRHNHGDCMDYNLCLDTGVIGIDRCVDIIASIIGDIKSSASE